MRVLNNKSIYTLLKRERERNAFDHNNLSIFIHLQKRIDVCAIALVFTYVQRSRLVEGMSCRSGYFFSSLRFFLLVVLLLLLRVPRVINDK